MFYSGDVLLTLFKKDLLRAPPPPASLLSKIRYTYPAMMKFDTAIAIEDPKLFETPLEYADISIFHHNSAYFSPEFFILRYKDINYILIYNL